MLLILKKLPTPGARENHKLENQPDADYRSHYHEVVFVVCAFQEFVVRWQAV
jgi:hypothetical protein